MPAHSDEALVFDCEGESLIGILHRPAVPLRKGVVILVGGPQYRVGSHRQFLLLARFLADHGIAVFRFDYRGMGDSSGEAVSFLDCSPDLSRAIDVFMEEVPELSEIVIWGLCDAATAAAIYAPRDERVSGLTLLNPWARSERSQAATHLRHYYFKRLLEGEFWRRLFGGQGSAWRSLRAFLGDLRKSLLRGRSAAESGARNEASDFRKQMLQSMRKFSGPALLIISDRDLTAREFMDMAKGSADWRRLMSSDGITVRHIAGADHTFSTQTHRQEVEKVTCDWLRSW